LETCLGEHSKHAQLTPEGRSLTAEAYTYVHIDRDVHMYIAYIYVYIYVYSVMCVQRIHIRVRSCGGGGRAGDRGDGSDISEAVETEVDKQTCRRPRGHRKHGGVAGVGGAVKREIRVHPRARFSIVRPAAFVERQTRRGIAMEIDLSGRKVPEAAHGLVMEIRRATRH